MSFSVDVDVVILDLKGALGAQTDRQLAARLGIDPTAIAAWRRRNKIPEKYMLLMRRRDDEYLAGDSVAASFYKLADAYAFALVAFATANVKDTIAIATKPDHLDIMLGFRLRKLYAHASAEFRRCNPDKDRLRKVYEALRAKLSADDLFEWLETLPDPL